MNFLDSLKYNEVTHSATFQMLFGNEFREQARSFHSIYENEKVLIITDTTKNSLKAKNKRVCRFCKKKYPEVTFKNKAHLIPQFLGNKNLLSDFECDNCNRMFGEFENELANFIGLARTISRLTGKEGVPKFKSPNKDFSMWIDEKDNLAYSELENKNNVIFDKEKNQVTFHSNSNPYNSLKVYKCLVKIALSILNEKDIENYRSTIDFLKNPNISIFQNSLSTIHEYGIPGPYLNFPIIFSFLKKRNIVNDLIPTRAFILSFRNSMIQFSIPYDKMDEKINMPNSSPTINLLPPLIDQEWIDKYANPNSKFIDLSANKKVRDRTETITVQIE